MLWVSSSPAMQMSPPRNKIPQNLQPVSNFFHSSGCLLSMRLSLGNSCLCTQQRGLLVHHTLLRRLLPLRRCLLQSRPQRTCHYNRTTKKAPSAGNHTPNSKIKAQSKDHLHIQHSRRLGSLIQLQACGQEKLQRKAKEAHCQHQYPFLGIVRHHKANTGDGNQRSGGADRRNESKVID